MCERAVELRTARRKVVAVVFTQRCLTEAYGDTKGLIGSEGPARAADAIGVEGIGTTEGSTDLGRTGKRAIGMMRHNATEDPASVGSGDVVPPLGARARVMLVVRLVLVEVAETLRNP